MFNLKLSLFVVNLKLRLHVFHCLTQLFRTLVARNAHRVLCLLQFALHARTLSRQHLVEVRRHSCEGVMLSLSASHFHMQA